MKILILTILLILVPFAASAQTQEELRSLILQTISLLQQLIAKLTVQLQVLLWQQQQVLEVTGSVPVSQIPLRNETATTTLPEQVIEIEQQVSQISTTTLHKCSSFWGDDFLYGQTFCNEDGKGVGEVATATSQTTHKCSSFRGDDFLPGQTVCGEDGKAIQ